MTFFFFPHDDPFSSVQFSSHDVKVRTPHPHACAEPHCLRFVPSFPHRHRSSASRRIKLLSRLIPVLSPLLPKVPYMVQALGKIIYPHPCIEPSPCLSTQVQLLGPGPDFHPRCSKYTKTPHSHLKSIYASECLGHHWSPW